MDNMCDRTNQDTEMAMNIQAEFYNKNPHQDLFMNNPNQKNETSGNTMNEGNTKVNNNDSTGSTSIVSPCLEYTDPAPEIDKLFLLFNERFFWNKLDRVVVKWNTRMKRDAGNCQYDSRAHLCTINLSAPLLKLRPRKDLVETLLHEMIHAYHFFTGKAESRTAHGTFFQHHMHRINREAGTNISIYHAFHEEVKSYLTHWWRCTGPCQYQAPFYGYVKRTMNRAPGPNDIWWKPHAAHCNGEFIKIREPDNYRPRSKKTEEVLHWWRCTGPCKNRAPSYGYVKSIVNRAPSPRDFGWKAHSKHCNGVFIKVKEPENYRSRSKKTQTVFHWWRCNGPCKNQAPTFGYVKRIVNRAPGPKDFWWKAHSKHCNGEFIEVKEPEKYQSRSSQTQEEDTRGFDEWERMYSVNTTSQDYATVTKPQENATITKPVGNATGTKPGSKNSHPELNTPSTSSAFVPFKGEGHTLGSSSVPGFAKPWLKRLNDDTKSGASLSNESGVLPVKKKKRNEVDGNTSLNNGTGHTLGSWLSGTCPICHTFIPNSIYEHVEECLNRPFLQVEIDTNTCRKCHKKLKDPNALCSSCHVVLGEKYGHCELYNRKIETDLDRHYVGYGKNEESHVEAADNSHAKKHAKIYECPYCHIMWCARHFSKHMNACFTVHRAKGVEAADNSHAKNYECPYCHTMRCVRHFSKHVKACFIAQQAKGI